MNEHYQRGFTLIELCVAMAIFVVAGFFAIPQLSALQQHWTLQSVTQAATTTLNAARILALKRNSVMSACASVDNQQCGTFTSASRFLLIVDDRNGTVVRSTRIADGYSVQGVPTRPQVRFQPNGWSSGANMTLKLCDRDNVWRKDIIINNAGRIRSQTHSEQVQC